MKYLHTTFTSKNQFQRLPLLFSSSSVHANPTICCADLLYFPTVLKTVLRWNNQSQESEMQLQPDRVTETSVYRETKDSIQASRLPHGPNG